jgi:hypothetical protein
MGKSEDAEEPAYGVYRAQLRIAALVAEAQKLLRQWKGF